ncbi:MATE family efflux transporter [Parablautia intestinalis]|uniref:MATE family efflux transporter n=1 Tax=Parablautia intestinalis TaxID=2320100 RepID=UPI0023BD2BCE|nr:MATE family efflux transporter [Parablautia intestinalis]MDE7048862.1 MATE family efflux transporter [Lachnospiraceae bacterium]
MMLLTRDRSFYRDLLVLAIPVALQNFITFAVTLADNLMTGALGDASISGVYMGGQIQTLLQLFSGGIEGAILILAAQYWGKADTESIKRIISIGVHFTLAVGTVFTCLCAFFPRKIIGIFTPDLAVIGEGADYLRIVCFSYLFFCLTQALIAAMRSVEVANIGMAVSGVSLITNISLNYALIFGKFGFPALGVRGAAIATLISRIVETAIMAVYVFRIDRKLCLKLSDFFRTDALLRKDFIRYGLPIAGGQVIWGINMMGNSMILGRFDQYVIAGASIANTLNALAFVTMNGMSAAVSIITGKTVGAGKIELLKEYARTVQILFLGLGLLTGAMIALAKTPFIGMYAGVSKETAGYAHQFCTVLAVTMVGTCYQAACLAGLVKAGGDVGFVFKMDTFFVLLVVLPSAVISARLGAPAWLVFACLKCDQILKCFVAFFKIRSFNWIKNLTRD